MLAKDIMTKHVVTVTPETTINDAIKLLVENEISGLIVVNPDKDVIGVISEKDLMVAFDWLGVTKATIRDYYNKAIVSVSEDTPIEEINRLLVLKNIKRVPVLRGTKLAGVVSRRDILKFIFEKNL